VAVYSTSTSVASDTTLITDDVYGGTARTYPSSTTYPADPLGQFPDTIRLQTTALRYEWITQPTWTRRQMPTEVDLDLYWSEAQTRIRTVGHNVFNNATERNAIVTSPVEGQMVWLEDLGQAQIYDGSAWRTVSVTPGVPFTLGSSSLGGTDVLG
jgi:hypothetical protein